MDDEFIKTYQKIEDALSETVKISHGQVIRLVVGDLIAKYRFNVKRNDKEWANAFEKILRYYLSEKELADVIAAAKE